MNTVLGTFAIYHREPRSPKPHEIEIVTLLVKIAALAIERERGRQQRQLLMDELAHRMKNSLAVVGAIASNTLRPHVEKERYQDFERRLMALAQVQSLLAQTNWAGIDVGELIRNIATAPFRDGTGRFELDGPPVKLPSQLTLPSGKVRIVWGYGQPAEEKHFFLKWSESNVAGVAEPKSNGFGSRMIKQAFAQSVGGDAVWNYRPEGLEVEIRLPVTALEYDVNDPAPH